MKRQLARASLLATTAALLVSCGGGGSSGGESTVTVSPATATCAGLRSATGWYYRDEDAIAAIAELFVLTLPGTGVHLYTFGGGAGGGRPPFFGFSIDHP
jgi:hypothetical protein